MLSAIYKCLHCEHQYAVATGPTTCPQCSEGQIEWLNYEEMVASGVFEKPEDFERKSE